jgi:serum/glucocorticoid-regulated kinase 2
MNSPFFVNLHYSFMSETKILFIMDFVRGGDLFMHLLTLGQFNEDQTRFIIAQLALALGSLHSFNILYRDLKLENILMNDNGKNVRR